MDLRQLEMFRAVAEEGTFSRAAERLRVSQSAISRQVKLLEEELGGRLLHRGARKVALSAGGGAAAPHRPPRAPELEEVAVADLRHPGPAAREPLPRPGG